jgi:hypothetical protein
MTRTRLVLTVAAVGLDLAAGLALMETLRTVALPSILGLLRHYGLAG